MRLDSLLIGLLLSVPVTAYASGEELPELEFLEYLGEYQGENGATFDPLDLAEVNRSSKEKPEIDEAGENKDADS